MFPNTMPQFYYGFYGLWHGFKLLDLVIFDAK